MANLQSATDFFCSELSQDVGEEMAGTAVHAPLWFLLEYAGPWRARATDDNDLAAPVQAWLAGLAAQVDNGRFLPIQRKIGAHARGAVGKKGNGGVIGDWRLAFGV